MILADTSAWVEYDRATGSAVDLRLAELIAAEGPVAVTEPVIVEVLAGARSDARRRTCAGFCCDSICTVSTPPPTSRVPHASTAAAARLAPRPADWSTV